MSIIVSHSIDWQWKSSNSYLQTHLNHTFRKHLSFSIFLSHLHQKRISFFVVVVFETGFLYASLAILSWNSLCRPGWPRTQKSACLCLPSARIKGMRPHCPHLLFLHKQLKCRSQYLQKKSHGRWSQQVLCSLLTNKHNWNKKNQVLWEILSQRKKVESLRSTPSSGFTHICA